MTWELTACSTELTYPDLRYREYTKSEKRAKLFMQIPTLFSKRTGHGILFESRLCRPREPRHRELKLKLADYVKCEMDKLRENERRK